MFEWFASLAISRVEFWVRIFDAFRDFGPLPAILLTFVEAVIPILPLFAMVAFNVASHGAFWGFIYSWIGSVLGAISVFLLFRYLRDRALLHRFLSLKRIGRMIRWVSKQKHGLLFLLTVFPFTPSFLVNISFGLSHFSKRIFIKTIIVSKAFMIASLVLFGSAAVKSLEEPAFIILALALLALFYLMSNAVNRRFGVKDIKKK